MSFCDLFADLHIHSNNSDGTCSLEEICDLAVAHNVGVISVTDHNCISGVKKLFPIANERGIRCVPGLELDSIYNGKRCHILAYDFNPDDLKLNRVAESSLNRLQDADKITLGRIAEDYSLDLSLYDSFEFDAKKGGWKLIQFMVNQGLTDSMDEAVKIMKKYKERVAFPDVRDIINVIHEASGVAILAHPGETFHEDGDGDEETLKHIKTLLEYGMDGIECFYPRHKSGFEKVLYEICRRNDLYITAGSDFHGDFFKRSKQNIGCEFKRVKDLELKNLIH